MALPILVSATLFYLSFPNILSLQGFYFFAWIFAIPFFITLEEKNIFGRLKAGLLFGLLSNLAAVNWMIPYSFWGYLLLSMALASQAVIFAVLYQPAKEQKFWHFFYVPCAWVLSEILRKFFMMGESWDLGHSQGFDTGLLQIARSFGSAGISFLLIFVNYLLYWIIFRLKRPRYVVGILLFVMLVQSYGLRSIPKDVQTSVFHICILQPNSDFHGELTEARIDKIVDEDIALSKKAVKDFQPDLVIWPETAVPTDFLDDPLLKVKILKLVKEVGAPFLIGAAITDSNGTHNSAVLLNKDGTMQQIYHKRYLVPLTEYIPPSLFWKTFAKIFKVESPDFVPGDAAGMMEITSRKTGTKARFGVAICSEDNVGKVFRQYTKDGAGFVVVLLNNGWFSQKEGLVMHAEHSIIHAVENGIPVIRVANTGLSGLIDRFGRISQEYINSLEQKRFFHVEVTFKPLL